MLVLSRRKGESVVIGNDIRITVVEIKGDQVRLGIEAPRTVPVHRHEVYEQVVAENTSAARSMPETARLRARRRS